jgi:hypothetical protein
MDESETYGGLRAASVLATVLGDSLLASRATGDADNLYAAVSKLWDPALGAFDWAADGSSTTQNDWSVLYPDDMEQVFAVAYGLATGTRAQQIMATFEASQPNWADPSGDALQSSNGAVSESTVGYWPVAIWALEATGQSGAPAAFARELIEDAAQSASDAWPYTPANAAQLIIAEADTGGSPPE